MKADKSSNILQLRFKINDNEPALNCYKAFVKFKKQQMQVASLKYAI